MQLKIIRSDREHQTALKHLKGLARSATRKNARLRDNIEILAMLIEQYEQRRYPLEAVDPIDAIELEIEQRGLSTRDLEPYLGPRSRVSEVLNRKRGLSLSQIRKLHDGLGIPLRILVQATARKSA
jgi:HTH-type transcriptional regulator / antitoxin HigA